MSKFVNDFDIEYVLKELEENKEKIPLMFEDIHQQLTPDFTGEDWMTLFNQMIEGNQQSKDMFCNLFLTKVVANISPDFWDEETLQEITKYFSEIGWVPNENL